MNDGRSGDHGVLGDGVRLPVHEARPLSESGRIQWQYGVGCLNLVQPNFQFLRFVRVLLMSDFDPCLYLSDG